MGISLDTLRLWEGGWGKPQNGSFTKLPSVTYKIQPDGSYHLFRIDVQLACWRLREKEQKYSGCPYWQPMSVYNKIDFNAGCMPPPTPMSDTEYNDVLASQEAYGPLVNG